MLGLCCFVYSCEWVSERVYLRICIFILLRIGSHNKYRRKSDECRLCWWDIQLDLIIIWWRMVFFLLLVCVRCFACRIFSFSLLLLLVGWLFWWCTHRKTKRKKFHSAAITTKFEYYFSKSYTQLFRLHSQPHPDEIFSLRCSSFTIFAKCAHDKLKIQVFKACELVICFCV